MNKDKELSKELEHVARQGGTEPPFSGKYVHENAHGMYKCIICGNPLFASEAKFDTAVPGLMGWPSFEEAIPGSVEFRPDNSFGMGRTEVVCKKCGAHLGHVFDEEKETKTGKHYCVNSVCLELEKETK